MMRAKHGKFFSRLIGNTVCNLYPLSGFVQWDVIKGDYLMNIVCTRMDGVVALPAQAAAPETSSSDDMLIRRIAQGDQLAMRTLFGRHQVPLYRWLLRLVGDQALAEDLVERCISRRLAPSRLLPRALVGFDLAAGNCPLQGALGASPSDGCGIG